MVDETAVKINGELSWLDTAIYLDTKLILDTHLFGRYDTDSAAVFLHGICEKYNHSEATFFVGQFDYRTTLSRLELNSWVDYTDRNLIEKWFHILKMRVDRFHNSGVSSQANARRWIEHFLHYFNHQRSQ